MRYFYALLFVVLPGSGFSQIDSLNVASNNKIETPVVRIRCYTALQPDRPPLYIIDGEPVNAELLGFLKPDDIESINVLKEASASSVYGAGGINGVIIIKTKTSCFRSFQAIDAEDNTGLAGTTFTFTAVDGTEVVRLAADEDGKVISTSFPIGKKYTLTISSVGYKDFHTVYSRKKEKIIQHYRLSRDVKESAEVIVKAIHGSSLRRITVCGGLGFVNQSAWSTTSVEATEATTRLVPEVYPNPVSRGSITKIEVRIEEELPFQVQLLNLSGVTLSTVAYKPVKGLNRVEIPVASQWAAGVYFLRVISQHGKLLKQHKLIVQ